MLKALVGSFLAFLLAACDPVETVSPETPTTRSIIPTEPEEIEPAFSTSSAWAFQPRPGTQDPHVAGLNIKLIGAEGVILEAHSDQFERISFIAHRRSNRGELFVEPVDQIRLKENRLLEMREHATHLVLHNPIVDLERGTEITINLHVQVGDDIAILPFAADLF